MPGTSPPSILRRNSTIVISAHSRLSKQSLPMWPTSGSHLLYSAYTQCSTSLSSSWPASARSQIVSRTLLCLWRLMTPMNTKSIRSSTAKLIGTEKALACCTLWNGQALTILQKLPAGSPKRTYRIPLNWFRHSIVPTLIGQCRLDNHFNLLFV